MVKQTFTIETIAGIENDELFGCLEDTISYNICKVEEVKND